MKTLVAMFALLLIGLHGVCAQQDTTEQQMMAVYAAWVENLYEFGVRTEGDSFIVTEEAKLAAMDPVWRKVLYPEAYSWQQVKALLEARDLKKTLWYLINLWYADQDRAMVTTLLSSMDQEIDVQKALAAAFYTYIFFDPEIGHFADNKPVIDHPDVMEGKLNAIREMVREQGMR